MVSHCTITLQKIYSWQINNLGICWARWIYKNLGRSKSHTQFAKISRSTQYYSILCSTHNMPTISRDPITRYIFLCLSFRGTCHKNIFYIRCMCVSLCIGMHVFISISSLQPYLGHVSLILSMITIQNLYQQLICIFFFHLRHTIFRNLHLSCLRARPWLAQDRSERALANKNEKMMGLVK